jgi:hypothetical protein
MLLVIVAAIAVLFATNCRRVEIVWDFEQGRGGTIVTDDGGMKQTGEYWIKKWLGGWVD